MKHTGDSGVGREAGNSSEGSCLWRIGNNVGGKMECWRGEKIMGGCGFEVRMKREETRDRKQR